MRLIIQRVAHASVTINGKVKSSIGKGLLILVGIEDADDTTDAEWLCKKVANLRIFDDENGVMNLDVRQVGGEILVVSQFTLHASTRKGNRPSYIKAAPEAISRPLYERFAAGVDVHVNAHVLALTDDVVDLVKGCLLYTSPSPRD